ncbi:MAG: OmpA family protein [Leptospiraceae bacterium]|nr:OmpA family protein [Leptospiraceae bacterium]MCP5494318.1 OmpA family protein [Leptospiraceae bacterium]
MKTLNFVLFFFRFKKKTIIAISIFCFLGSCITQKPFYKPQNIAILKHSDKPTIEALNQQSMLYCVLPCILLPFFGKKRIYKFLGIKGKEPSPEATKDKDAKTFDKILPNKEEVVLKSILFPTGSDTLHPSSFKELDRLSTMLAKNPKIKLEIQGHTDNTGDEDKNTVLSQKRALAVANYLKSKGVDTKRLTAVGYGSKKPIADNKTPEGQKKNRRVSFIVVDK